MLMKKIIGLCHTCFSSGVEIMLDIFKKPICKVCMEKKRPRN